MKYLGLAGGTAAASAVLAACTGVQEAQNGGKSGPFPSTPGWRFVFVNHVTTNSFFVPTRSGLADAAALLGVPEPQWTGSKTATSPRWRAPWRPRSPARPTGSPSP